MSFIPTESAEDRAPAGSPGDALANNQDEPPSRPQPTIFLLGQDSQGRWVAQNMTGTCGGLFVDRTQALRYIRFEGGSRTFVTVSGVLELKLPRPPQMPAHFNAQAAGLAA